MTTTPRRLTFGARADEYEQGRPAWPEDAARWLVPEGAELVVELGAGTGKLTRALAVLDGPRVVAVEPDLRMLAVLREQGLAGIEGSAERIPLGDGEADAVVAGSALHWFELGPTLAEVRRVLRPGGRFAFGWNHRDVRHPTIARMSEAIYAVRSERTGWRSRDWAAEVTADALFLPVEHARFEHLHELPRPALERHLLSYATLASLPDHDRLRVFAEVGAILDRDPSLRRGELLSLPFVVDAYRTIRA